jgi:predicted DNA-binding protein YlxM (UPF0122 family)
MNILEEFEYLNNLLNIYGELISKSQKEILNDYYRLNLSISEIAINRNITRSAVNDAIHKGKQKLLDYENKLQIFEERNDLLKDVDRIKQSADKATIKELEKLERKIRHGI